MEEIDLKEMFTYYWKKKFIIIGLTLLVLALGLGYSIFLKTPMYQSEVTIILVSDTKNASSEMTQIDITMNQKLVSTYSEIIKSRTVLKTVKKDLKLNRSIDSMSGMIQVSGVDNTEIIRIRVSSDDNKEARDIANKLSEVFKKEVERIYNLENVSVIDKAEISTHPYNINPIKDGIIYGLIGVVLSVGIIFIVYYFDNSVKTTEQIEKKLGISVLGTVPKVGKKGK